MDDSVRTTFTFANIQRKKPGAGWSSPSVGADEALRGQHCLARTIRGPQTLERRTMGSWYLAVLTVSL